MSQVFYNVRPLPALAWVVIASFLAYSDCYAGVIAIHSGSNDPVAEGFLGPGGGVNVAPTFGDQGFAAWSMDHNGGPTSLYRSSPLSASELQLVDDFGWTMRVRARVTRSSTFENNLATFFSDGNRRYDLLLGLNSAGVTFAHLNDQVITPTNTPGQTFVLDGSGSSYHLFELVYDASVGSADLFVDGLEVISDYAGHDDFVPASGLYFGTANGSAGNFNLVSLETNAVPEPASALAFASIGLGLLVRRRRR
ncbi:MAG: PEP-CTERM sorting domain-containing protein [Planctomycetota bacterium]